MRRKNWLCVWLEREWKDKWVDELAWVGGIIGSQKKLVHNFTKFKPE
jgi:hypothetical protein